MEKYKYRIVRKYASDSSMANPRFTFFILRRNTGWQFLLDCFIELSGIRPMVFSGCGSFATLEEAKEWIGKLKETTRKENEAEAKKKELLSKMPDNKVVWRG